MKTYKHIFEEMLKEENIRQCFIEAARRKTNRPEIARVLEEESLQKHIKILQTLLQEEKFRPPEHKKKLINEYTCGKIRTIIKPVYLYEQVVHHCIVKQLQPIILHGLYEHALGSIPGRGCHSGKKTMEKWLRSYKGKKFYILKTDVFHCFDTESIAVIEEKLKAVIKDEKFVRLCMIVLESEAHEPVEKDWINPNEWEDEELLCGLPLGFVTSQWFTQLNFKKLDHKITEDWRKEYAVDKNMRYADDIVVLGRNKRKLHKLRIKMDEYLHEEMQQKLKDNWQVFRFEYKDKRTGKVRGRALDFMGFVFHYNRTTLRKAILKRSTRKAHKISKKEKVNWYDASCMLSSVGWYTHTDTYDYYLKYIKPYVNIQRLKKIVSKHAKKGVQNGVRMVSGGKYGKAGGVGHAVQPVSGISEKEYQRNNTDGRNRNGNNIQLSGAHNVTERICSISGGT